MAAGNPSTIGTGTEVLRRSFAHGISATDTVLINGVADHIYTLLSVVVCEQAGAAETFSMFIDPDTGTDNIGLVQSTALPANGTYIFSEKIVITNTDDLVIWTSSGNVDIYTSYIDQDWS